MSMYHLIEGCEEAYWRGVRAEAGSTNPFSQVSEWTQWNQWREGFQAGQSLVLVYQIRAAVAA